MTAPRFIAATILLTLSLPTVAHAVSFAPPTTGDGGILAGPKVEEEAQKATPGRMNKDGQQVMRREEIPLQQWMGALKELKLTVAQQTKVAAIMQEFKAAQQNFDNSLSDEEKAIFKQSREARAAGKEPSKEARELIQKMESNRPKAEVFQQKLWAELTSEQQAQFKEKLDAIKERMAERKRDGRGPLQQAGRNAKNPPETKGAGDDDSMNPQMGDSKNKPADATKPEADKSTKDEQRPTAGKGKQGQRRLKFLQSQQAGKNGKSAESPRHKDGEPTDKDRDFKFDKDNQEPAKPAKP